METQLINKLLTAIASNAASMTCGIDASTVVAINCIGGRSFGQFLVYIATFDFGSRYQGMKLAFGEDTEIFKTTGALPPQPLTTDDYDIFVRTALGAHDAQSAPGSVDNNDTGNFYLRYHSNFPIIRWGRKTYPFVVAFLYTFVALTSIFFLLSVRILLGGTKMILFEIIYLLTFFLVSLYSNTLLYVQRSVCFVEIEENRVSQEMKENWRRLRRLAVPFPQDANEAVEHTRKGLVSKATEESTTLLMPAMCISTVIEDEPASWWLLLNDLRGPLMAGGLWSVPLGDSRIDWGMAYGIVAYAQARLQRAVAERYLRDAKPRNVFWFRRYAAHKDNYPVAENRRFALKSKLYKGWDMRAFTPPQKED